MKIEKWVALMGLGLSPLAITALGLRIADLTLVLAAVLLPNPATSGIGSLFVGSLLLRAGLGVVPYMFFTAYVL